MSIFPLPFPLGAEAQSPLTMVEWLRRASSFSASDAVVSGHAAIGALYGDVEKGISARRGWRLARGAC